MVGVNRFAIKYSVVAVVIWNVTRRAQNLLTVLVSKCGPILGWSSSFSTPSFQVYRAYLKILVFPFYKAQFGCFPSLVQIPRCIKSLHASIKRKLTNACTLCMHALQLMH